MLVGYLLLILAVAQISIGAFFLIRHNRKLSRVSFGLLALCSALYVGTNGVSMAHWVGHQNILEILIWVEITLITCSFFLFSFSFPFLKKNGSNLVPLLGWPILFFVTSLAFTPIVVSFQTDSVANGQYTINAGPFIWQFALFLVIYISWAMINLTKRQHLAQDGQRITLRTNAYFALLWALAVITFDIVLPLLGIMTFSYIGSIISAIWIITATRAFSR